MNIKPNPIMWADAYTISSNGFAAEAAREHSVYNFTNRYSPKKNYTGLALDNRMTFFGINHLLAYYLQNPVTHDNIEEAESFMSTAHSFGGGLHFPKLMWQRVVNEYGGYLPINICALREGYTFFPNEPTVVVKADDGFGELAAHLETRLVGAISIGSAVATMCRHWLLRMREQVAIEQVKLYGQAKSADIDSIARWMIHNFGSRACDSSEESILTGMAHMLSFNGTDNFDAALMAWRGGVQRPVGTSILALAHRNVMPWNEEFKAYVEIGVAERKGSLKIVSCVADTYNYNNAVDIITGLAIDNPDVCYVIRPDSGDAYLVIKTIYDVCKAKGITKEVNGYLLPKNVRFIYGDSVSPETQIDVMTRLRNYGMLTTLWGIWGVGGYIRNNATRDTLSSAFKLAMVGGCAKPMVKLSETPTKLSVPYHTYLADVPKGRPRVMRGYACDNSALMKTYYHMGQMWPDSYGEVHKASLTEFDSWSDFIRDNPDYGSKREDVLTSDIIYAQDAVFAQHRRIQAV